MGRRKIKTAPKFGKPWTNYSDKDFVGKDCTRLTNGYFKVTLWDEEDGIGNLTYMTVSRADRKPVTGWDDLQRIKNELVGENRIGIEIYSKKEQLFEAANVRHVRVYAADSAAFELLEQITKE